MKMLQPRSPIRWTAELRHLPAVSIRQPFAWLVVNGIKDIENRSWRTHHRGPILIHASASREYLNDEVRERMEQLAQGRIPDDYDLGGIIGIAEITDCVQQHPSPWKAPNTWGWVLTNAHPLPFRECRGKVGFFYPLTAVGGKSEKLKR